MVILQLGRSGWWCDPRQVDEPFPDPVSWFWPPARAGDDGQEKKTASFRFFFLQVCRKAVKKVFKLNLMVVGESGLGKSTLVKKRFTNICWWFLFCTWIIYNLHLVSYLWIRRPIFFPQINSMFLTDCSANWSRTLSCSENYQCEPSYLVSYL